MFLKEKIRFEALVYLKNQQIKQEKIKDIKYSELKMQDYLAEGDRSIIVSKTIYKARGMTLDIKEQKKWKYDDILCEGCKEHVECGEEIMRWDKLGNNIYQAGYTWLYSDLATKQITIISYDKKLMNKLGQRQSQTPFSSGWMDGYLY